MTNTYTYIYLLMEREFIKTGEPIYKIGQTNQDPPWKRFQQYPKNSRLILLIMANKAAEDVIKKELKSTAGIKQRKDIGLEYFEGDVKVIRQICLSVSNQESSVDQKTVISSNQPIAKNIHTQTTKQGNVMANIQAQIVINDNNQMSVTQQVMTASDQPISENEQISAPPQVVTDNQPKSDHVSLLRYQCPRCKQIFPKKYNLDKHLKRKSPCQVVGAKPVTSNQIQPPKENTAQKIVCAYCNTHIKHKETLQSHYINCTKYQSCQPHYLAQEVNKLKMELQKQIDEIKQQKNNN